MATSMQSRAARVRPSRLEPRLESSRSTRRPARRPEPPVLDQAIAINGEVRVKLLGLNLLPIQVRLLVSSKDVAAQLGLDWWRKDREATARRNGSKR